MPRPNHALVEDSFAPLRAEAEKLIQAFAGLRQSLASLTRSNRQPGGATAGAVGGGGSVDPLAASQDRAAKSAERFDRAVGRASASVNSLQRAVHGVGNIATLLGFEDAGRKADGLAMGLAAVRDVVGGIVALRAPLFAISSVVVITLAAVGALQEGIRATTGETLTLTGTIAGVALGLAKAVVESVSGWKILFNDLAQFIRETFAGISRAILAPVEFALQQIASAFIKMAKGLRESGIPVLQELGRGFALVAKGAFEASTGIRAAYQHFGQAAQQGATETQRANREILDSMKFTVEGIQKQINKVFDTKQGASLLGNPAKALGQLASDLKALLPNVLKDAGAEVAKPGGGLLPASSEMRSAGQEGGVAYVSGFSEALYSSQADTSSSIYDLLTGKTDRSPLGIYGAVTGLLGSFAGASRGRAFASGGEVTPGGMASLAHFARGVRGLAAGGRPSWIPSSDTVAAWLTPGEWVQPLRSVAKYGARFMASVQSLQFPADVAAAFSGGVSVPTASPSPAPRGYASGGSVAGGGMGGTTVLPVFASTPQAMETLLHGGAGTVLERWLNDRGYGR